MNNSTEILNRFSKKKKVPKTQTEKFKKMELKNPNIRTLSEVFDLVIEN